MHTAFDRFKTLFFRRKKDVDMTEGNIIRHLLIFAFPLLIGNLFQQLYNMVDTWVVGNFVSNEAFAAVGSVGPIINMLIGFFMGLSSGAGVVISQYYGAGRHEEVSRTVHTALVMTGVLSVLFTVVGIVMTPAMLTLMKTDADVIAESAAYLRVYFSGIIGLLFYNIGAGILRAVGDSQRPFYFLVVSALLNTGLDLLFVIGFDMGVRGVALATIIAQGVSAVLIMIALYRSDACIRFVPAKLRIHRDILGKVIRVGIPAALQMTITAFSNVFVQSYINGFGKFYMSGWTAYAKVDQLLFLPMQSLSLASTTFVGQNLGRRQVDRAKHGIRISLGLAMLSTVVLMMPVLVFANPIVGFFNDDPDVREIGTLLLRHITPFYVLCCINQIYSGALRGAGNSRAPMLIMLASFVCFRQIYLFVISRIFPGNFLAVAYGYPAGWLLCSALTLLYFRHVDLERTSLVAR
ncbi:MAG: MATE family efflux transporter [Clostridia bacterium]|nr:MATE family efflux transporter [Clostridia bacterium]